MRKQSLVHGSAGWRRKEHLQRQAEQHAAHATITAYSARAAHHGGMHGEVVLAHAGQGGDLDEAGLRGGERDAAHEGLARAADGDGADDDDEDAREEDGLPGGRAVGGVVQRVRERGGDAAADEAAIPHRHCLPEREPERRPPACECGPEEEAVVVSVSLDRGRSVAGA